MSRMKYLYNLYSRASISEENLICENVELNYALGVIENIMSSNKFDPETKVTITRKEVKNVNQHDDESGGHRDSNEEEKENYTNSWTEESGEEREEEDSVEDGELSDLV